jgi:hypothetical protein
MEETRVVEPRVVVLTCATCPNVLERTFAFDGAKCRFCKIRESAKREELRPIKVKLRNARETLRKSILRHNMEKATKSRTKEDRQATMQRVNELRRQKTPEERSEAARKAAKVRIERHGLEHLHKWSRKRKWIAAQRREVLIKNYGRDKGGLTFEQRSATGRKGSAAVRAKYGDEYMRELGRKAALARMKKRSHDEHGVSSAPIAGSPPNIE